MVNPTAWMRGARRGSGLHGALLLFVVVAAGCERGGQTPGSEPIAVVDGVVLDATVVQMIADRDHITADAARQRAIETLQLAAAAKAEHAAQSAAEPEPMVAAARRTQLLRAARARVWLDAIFLPSRGAADIPQDDPALARALASPRYVHPRVHRVCQLVLIPAGLTDIEAARAITTDPQWQARAHAWMDPLAERLQRYVPVTDPHVCRLAEEVVPKLRPALDDDTITLRLEPEGGFDLTACIDAEPGRPPDAPCETPQFDPAWTERIAQTAPGTWTGVFQGGWGLHLAYVAAIEEPRSPDRPEDMAWIREQIHTAWLAREWTTALERLTQARAVRIAASPGQDGAAPPGEVP